MKVFLTALFVALLAAIVVPNLTMDPEHGSRRVSTRSDMHFIATALSAYKQDNGTYPSTRQGLAALVVPPSGEPPAPHWKGYFKNLPEDSWHRPYRYVSPTATGDYELMSYGADGQPGGEGEDAVDLFEPPHPEPKHSWFGWF